MYRQNNLTTFISISWCLAISHASHGQESPMDWISVVQDKIFVGRHVLYYPLAKGYTFPHAQMAKSPEALAAEYIHQQVLHVLDTKDPGPIRALKQFEQDQYEPDTYINIGKAINTYEVSLKLTKGGLTPFEIHSISQCLTTAGSREGSVTPWVFCPGRKEWVFGVQTLPNQVTFRLADVIRTDVRYALAAPFFLKKIIPQQYTINISPIAIPEDRRKKIKQLAKSNLDVLVQYSMNTTDMLLLIQIMMNENQDKSAVIQNIGNYLRSVRRAYPNLTEVVATLLNLLEEAKKYRDVTEGILESLTFSYPSFPISLRLKGDLDLREYMPFEGQPRFSIFMDYKIALSDDTDDSESGILIGGKALLVHPYTSGTTKPETK